MTQQMSKYLFLCSYCSKTISIKEYYFSKGVYGGGLCMDHQHFLSPYLSNATSEAKQLYFALLERKIPVHIEKWDGYKHIDLAIPAYKLNLEVEGVHHYYSHQAEADLKRDLYSLKKGFVTLRIPNSLIRENLVETANNIANFLTSRL